MEHMCAEWVPQLKPSETNLPPFNKSFLVIGELSDNNVSDDGLSLATSVAVNKQILEVILTLGNDVILMVYQINIHYNTYAHDSAFHHINWGLCVVKSIPINDSLKEAIYSYCTLWAHF